MKHITRSKKRIRNLFHVPCSMFHEDGFTLVEILITIVILVVIFTFGLLISFDFYRSYAFNSEKNIIISVLQRARNQSVNNVNETRHGVHFEDSSGLKYIMFECPPPPPDNNPQCTSYNSSYPKVEIASSWGILIGNLPITVIFDQLNGDLVEGDCDTDPQSTIDINVSGGTNPYTISVNCEGRISW